MKKTRAQILRGENLEEAEEALKGMLTWVGHISEPWLFLALITLLHGDIAQAQTMLLMPYGIRLHRDKVTCYDPEEIAWILFLGLLTDNQDLIQRAEVGASQMDHISLRRMQWLKKVLAKEADVSNPPADLSIRKESDRCGIHWLGVEVTMKDWLALVSRIFAANGKKAIL